MRRKAPEEVLHTAAQIRGWIRKEVKKQVAEAFKPKSDVIGFAAGAGESETDEYWGDPLE